jgi:uncharacterized protein (TIGR03382 family)
MRTYLLAGALSIIGAPAFGAMTYSFQNITGNSAQSAAQGVAQLSVTVTAAPGGQVAFTFNNSGPNQMSITDVYFDDGSLLGISSITDSGNGVDFSQGATPPNLPGGNNINPAFVTTQGFSADSNPPAQPNGVGPGEWLTITFSLINGQTYADVITELNASRELRIGIHVQGFSNGQSESFIHVPTPGALALVGMTGLVALRRRR